MNIFVRGALFPHWTRKRSGGVVASVSVGVPWTGRVGPSGLVWTGCRERVGLDALDRTSRPEWVGPEGLLRACRLGCLGLDESTRMGWLGGVVVSVSVWMPWSGRVDPNGLVRTGCRERVGWDALGRPSRPEWVGPCTVWIRSFWFETAVPGLLFPCASGRCLPCFVPLSPMPRPHLLAPGRCLPVLRTAAFRALFRCLLCLARTSLYPGVAFLCFGLLPSVLCFAVSYASPVPPCTQVVASCSPRPRSFLFFGPLFLPFGPLPLALLTLPALLPVQKKTPEGLAFGGFRLLSVANYFARAFRLTSLAALSASFGFFEMALLSCASAAVRSPSLTAMTARR